MASAAQLTTLQTVKDELQITSSTDDGYLTRQIKVASQMFTELCGREFHRQAGRTDEVVGEGGRFLYLKSVYPVTAINSVKYDGEAVDSDLYALQNREGLILRASGRWQDTEHQRLYEIEYDAGYVTETQAPFGTNSDPRDLPFDLENAIIQFVVANYRERGQSDNVASKKLGDTSIKWTTTQGRRVPQTFADAITTYGKTAIA